MITTADLNALIPTIVELVKNNPHEVGGYDIVQDEDGDGAYDFYYAYNSVIYEKDGWVIEVVYECSSYSERYGFGEIVELNASHYDSEGFEDAYFEGDDLNEMRWSINEILEKFRL